jgi:hypothetical protein
VDEDIKVIKKENKFKITNFIKSKHF